MVSGRHGDGGRGGGGGGEGEAGVEELEEVSCRVREDVEGEAGQEREVAGERAAAGQQLQEHNPEAVDIRRGADGVGPGPLRGQVPECAADTSEAARKA